jgi:hypothetical protein
MKARSCLLFTVFTLAAQFCFAEGSGNFLDSEVYRDFEKSLSLQMPPKLSFYSEHGLEQAKPVQLVAAARSAENISREDHVSEIIGLNRNRLRFCFERALAKSPLSVDSTLYFSVTKEGVFENMTGDFSAKGLDENIRSLFDCVSSQLKTLRAAKGTSDLTFRFKLKFGVRN